ncbi:S24/S26 family peptidase [Streptomyces sp. MB09-01]|uniref:S24/S26 family peptidase n=1 Tax=Streptomyces sp. MB09-01 TaxID=3028666 RepID=UPI0029B446F4|nr:S24/S26 family peptidase [Streptomyces sp. MB09-01]MDX3538553.1 S24/S26 family peptidase [Streptomyces sp. MB09-01]
MGMLDTQADRIGRGETVEFRPTGGSMVPLVHSRQRVLVAPADPALVEVGDIVLARVSGTVYLHLVSAVDLPRRRVQISNNHGRVNGWTGHDRVLGICLAVDGIPRPARRPRCAGPRSGPWASRPAAWTCSRCSPCTPTR